MQLLRIERELENRVQLKAWETKIAKYHMCGYRVWVDGGLEVYEFKSDMSPTIMCPGCGHVMKIEDLKDWLVEGSALDPDEAQEVLEMRRKLRRREVNL